ERDEESGLSYHTARYYMTWLGRWIGADPLGIGQGVNLFQYASNNPNNVRDMTGRSGEKIPGRLDAGVMGGGYPDAGSLDKNKMSISGNNEDLSTIEPNWVKSNVLITTETLRKEDVWTGPDMLSSEDFSHIRFTAEGFLEIDSNYQSSKNPFRWELLKS